MAGDNVTIQSTSILLLEQMSDPEVIEMQEHGTVTLDVLESGSSVTQAVRMKGKWEGRYQMLFHRTKLPENSAVGFDPDNDSHPVSGASTFRKGFYLNASMSSSMSMGEMAALVAQGEPQSPQDIVELETQGHIISNRKTLNQIYQNGSSGKMAAVANNGWDDANQRLTVDNVARLKEKQRLIIRHPTTGTVVNGRVIGNAYANHPVDADGDLYEFKVVSVDDANQRAVLTREDNAAIKQIGGAAIPVGAFNGMCVYRYDEQGKLPWGIPDFTSKANPSFSGFDPANPAALLTTDDLKARHLVGGIDKNVNKDWQPLSYTATGLIPGVSTATIAHLNRILNLIEKRSGGDIGWILGFCGYDINDQILADIRRESRSDFATSIPDGYGGFYEVIRYRNLLLVVDGDADPTAIRGVEFMSAFRTVPRAWQVDTTTGAGWNRQYGKRKRGRQMFDAYMVTHQQLMFGRLHGNFEITAFDATI